MRVGFVNKLASESKFKNLNRWLEVQRSLEYIKFCVHFDMAENPFRHGRGTILTWQRYHFETQRLYSSVGQ